jgi:TonB-linked SusC/RagA family outer membrane protein
MKLKFLRNCISKSKLHAYLIRPAQENVGRYYLPQWQPTYGSDTGGGPQIIRQLLMTMKVTAVLLLIFLTRVSAETYAQSITYKGKNVSLEKVFEAIEKQTDYVVFYDYRQIANARLVTIDVNKTPLKTFLELCFKNQPFGYDFEDKTIVITKPQVKTEVLPATAPVKQVNGRIVNADGERLQGATIQLKGSNIYVISDAAGDFKINASVGDVLLISYVGYKSAAVRINPLGEGVLEGVPANNSSDTKQALIANNANGFTIRLAASTSSLDQVQVIAYGTTSRRLNTGNTATVKAEDIQQNPVNNVMEALQGRVAGLFISQNSGLPNSTFNIQIRGQNSVAQSKDALYIIDGVPYTSSLLPNVGSSGSSDASPLSFINPADIESVDVLKDADATAIYGSRAANGVILITTKKGKAGPTKVDVNVYTGLSETPRKVQLMNESQYLAMRREAFKNSGVSQSATNSYDLNAWDTTRNADWQKRLLGQLTINTNAQIALSGGSENSTYRIYGGYDINKPPFPTDFGGYNAHKVSGGISLSTASANKRFRAQINANYMVDNTFLPSYNPTQYILLAPNAPEPFNPDGTLNYSNSFSSNPFSGFHNTYKGTTNNLTTSLALSYQITSSLQFRVTGGYNNIAVNGDYVYPIATQIGFPGIVNPVGSSTFSANTISSWITEPQLSYDTHISKGKLGALVGTTFQSSTTKGQQTYGTGYTNDILLPSLAGAATIYNFGSIDELYKFTSIYGRLNYNWEDKYIVDLTGRRDGSSRFGPGKKFGDFGAIGAAWLFTNENFFKHIPFLSFGKLRGSYGVTGNTPGDNYDYLSLNSYLRQDRPYQGATALAPLGLASPDLAWEVVKKAEAGLELGFLNDRILASVSYFQNRTSNQLLSYQLPNITGFNAVFLNRKATIQNSGTEITFTSKNIVSSGFNWTTNFNFTAYRNKLIAFPDLATSSYASTLRIGQPINLTFVYQAAGVNPQSGVYQFYNTSGNIVPATALTTDDYYAKAISLDPKFYGGLQNTFSYHSFSLSLFFSFVKQMGGDYILRNGTAPGSLNGGQNNQPVALLNVWHKPGDIAKYQMYTSSTATAAGNAFISEQYSDAAYTDASYIRLKNVSFSYQLPQTLFKKLKIDKARIYFQAENLLTITKYAGPDPEGQGLIPPLRIMTLGAQVSF